MQFIEPWATLEARVDLAAAWGSVPLSVVGLATSLIESELGSGEATVYLKPINGRRRVYTSIT